MTAVEVCDICDIAGCRHIRERAARAVPAIPTRLWVDLRINGFTPESVPEAEKQHGVVMVPESEVEALVKAAVEAERDFWIKLSNALVDKMEALEAAAIRATTGEAE